VTVHCEYDELIEFYKERLRKKGRNDVLVNADSRPPATETEAVHRVLTLGELTGARIHVAHASLPETLSMVMQARARGVSVSAETCPHYLTLTRDDIARIGAYAICNPPLRGVAAVEGLWDSLRRGALDCIGTDHGAYTEELKSNPDYWSMAAGISCIELMFPLIVGEAIKRNIDLSRLSAVFSGNAARLFGLYPKKGALLPGSDADCVLVDPNASWVIHGADLFSKSPGTAFEGIEVRTTVRRTLVRGRTVYLNEEGIGRGRILVRPGFGEFQPGPASSKTGRRSHA
jgi:dihydroorotase-like cyclic amidohydrolase